MGRQFEKRKHKMAKRWDRMAKAFTRVGREIAIAVRGGGPVPENNPALRRAMQNAASVNMPKDKVFAAIERAAGKDAEAYDEVVYEGYAPHGIAVLVETATDNPTRTVANLRLAFKKGNGSLGNSGSVAYMFQRQGVFKLAAEGLDADDLELELIDHGLEEMERLDADEEEETEAMLVVRCGFTDFNTMQTALEEKGLEPKSAETEYVPDNTMELGDEATDEVLELIDRLEQDDDVQRVFHNLA